MRVRNVPWGMIKERTTGSNEANNNGEEGTGIRVVRGAMVRAQRESNREPGQAELSCSLIRERPVEKEDELVGIRTHVTYDGGSSKKSEEELSGGRPSRGATVGADATTISKSHAARRGLMLSLPRPWRQEEGPLATTISFLFPAGPRRQRRREKEEGAVNLYSIG